VYPLRLCQSYGLCMYSYVAMLEHIHLLVYEPERGLLAEKLRPKMGNADHFFSFLPLTFIQTIS
jgi:hypothetical protein